MKLIRAVMGPIRGDFRHLASCMERVGQEVFIKGRDRDDIRLMQDIYMPVALQAGQDPKSVARKIQRQCNACWDEIVRKNIVEELLGQYEEDIHAPSDMIFYLEYYHYYGKGYFKIMNRRRAYNFSRPGPRS